ncbi:ArnT family glycosyltransferase [Thermodesulfobacteriota bacterium]
MTAKEPLKSSNARIVAACLLAILLLGAGLRFYGISGQPPYFIDEGDYLLEARWIYTATVAATGSAGRLARELMSGEDLWNKGAEIDTLRASALGHPIIMGRPLHSILCALPMFVTGYRWDSGALVSAFTGTLTILAVFFLGRRLYGERIGLIAVLVMSVMGYHLIYSRNAFCEANSLLPIVLAFIFYHKSRTGEGRTGVRDAALTGVLWGTAAAVHDRWLSMILIIWALEAHYWFVNRDVPVRTRFNRFILFHVGLMAVPSLIQLPYIVLIVVGKSMLGQLNIQTYFGILAKHFVYMQIVALTKGMVMRWSDLATYPYLFWKLNGPAVTTLMLAGIAVALARRTLSDLILMAWVFIPLAYFDMQVYLAQRYVTITLPAAALLAGRAFTPLIGTTSGEAQRSYWKVMAAIAGLAIVASSGLWSATRTMRADYGYPEAVKVIEGLGEGVICTNHVLLRAYIVPMDRVEMSPSSLDELRGLVEKGYRYYLVDYMYVYWNKGGEGGDQFLYTIRELSEKIRSSWLRRWGGAGIIGGIEEMEIRRKGRVRLIEDIESSIAPLAVIQNGGVATTQFLFEGNLRFTKTREFEREACNWGMDTLRIYDLEAYMATKDGKER